MVAKRQRRTPDDGLTEYERGLRALQALPASDEDPAEFWGPDWEEKLAVAAADVATGRVYRADSLDEFIDALMRRGPDRADV